VELQALAVMDAGQRGALRFVPHDAEAAKAALERINVPFEMVDVLLVEISNQHGGFRNVCERLAAEHLSIDYAYCAFGGGHKTKGGGLAVFKVNDRSKAQRVLSANGVSKKPQPFRRLMLAR